MVEVIEVNPTHRNGPKRVEPARGVFDGDFVVFRMIGQRNEADEATRLILKVAKAVKVVDAVAQGFDMPVEHGTCAAPSHAVPGAMNVQILLGGFLAAGNGGSD